MATRFVPYNHQQQNRFASQTYSSLSPVCDSEASEVFDTSFFKSDSSKLGYLNNFDEKHPRNLDTILIT
jgi:hypothetical protein